MKVVLKDGTEINNAMVGKSFNLLELTMTKQEAVTLLPKFMDEEVMSEITYVSGAWNTIYKGYKRFSHLDNPREDEMRVWMEGKEEETSSEKTPRFDDMYMPKGV